VQRQVLYLGEINDGQKAAWCRTIAMATTRHGIKAVSYTNLTLPTDYSVLISVVAV